MQNESAVRAITLELYEEKDKWEIPDGVTVIASYIKPDGMGGRFNELPDGSAACQIESNCITVTLVSQMLTTPGLVKLKLELVQGAKTLYTFPVYITVQENEIPEEEESLPYRKVGGFLPLPVNAQTNHVITVKAVDEAGNVSVLETKPYNELVQALGQDSAAVMSQKAVTDVVSKIHQTGPEFVNDIDQCTDPSKIYLLPDGYLYAYLKSEAPQYTNIVDLGDNNWSNGYRINSSGGIAAQEGTITTHFIPVSEGDVIRIKGLDVRYNYDGGSANACRYASDKSVLAGVFKISTMIQNGYASIVGDEITVPAGRSETNVWASGCCYQRFSGRLMDGYTVDDIVITINEEIVVGEAFQWCNTGRAYQPADYEDRILLLEENLAETADKTEILQSAVNILREDAMASGIPSYWEEVLTEKSAAIQNLQETGGKNCFSFAAIADIHESANLGKCSGALARRIMDACDIPWALVLGDGVTRESVATEEAMRASFTRLDGLLRPLKGRVLQTQGNHDGSWGDNGTTFYINDFPSERMHALVYRKMGLPGQAHFCDSGSSYYVDDVSACVRYIMLNTHYAPYEENADGSAKYSSFHNARFGQELYDWMIAEALNVETGWSIILGTHAPLNDECVAYFGGEAGDSVLMRRMLEAYNNRERFSGSFAGTMEWDTVAVDADFSEAAGQVIANIAGHTHVDSNGKFGIPVITLRCDGAEENTSALKAERVKGTTTEQSFDIITVNRAERAIYATRIGAGADRVITY